MSYQKNKIGVYDDAKIYLADGGIVVKWILEVNDKPVYFVRALSFRVFKDRFVYFIFDRHSIADNIIQPYLKVDFRLNKDWPAGFYNYIILVSYEKNKATLYVNNKQYNIDLIDKI
ncbi:hypothetical protein ACK323_20670 [Aeromonas enteropelogenes]|uniref:hypothetical protein n=1 Tax=Aeromonas enteropelogenes TaxID=29489 RepID=UPI003988E825